MYIVEIKLHYTNMNEIHPFETLKEANLFLVNKGFIYDSGDEESDYWVLNQFTTAEVRLNKNKVL